jgi:teichuronic acid biosynthesis protein TuaE
MRNSAVMKAPGRRRRLTRLGAVASRGFQSEGRSPAVSLASPGATRVTTLWRSWRLPTLLTILGLLTVAVRPELLLGDVIGQADWGIPRSILALALIVNALSYGVRRKINWPIAALILVMVLSVSLGHLHPDLTPALMLEGLAVLALPFAFTSVAPGPGSRQPFALLILLLPLLSAVVGALMQLGDPVPHWGFQRTVEDPWRLAGAAGHPEPFAILAFSGFAVALHEISRPGRRWEAALAVVNLVLVILSGTRMAIVASGVLLLTYGALSQDLRRLPLRHRWLSGVAATLVVAVAAFYWPFLYQRLFEPGTEHLEMSSRHEIWSFYLQEFRLSPWFGRGLGAAYIAGVDQLGDLSRTTPHNEYLHFLVEGGLVGFGLCLAAIGTWYHRLLQGVRAHDRLFLLALAPALVAYAFTVDLLIYWAGLALFAYLGVLAADGRASALLPEQRR